MLNSSSVELWPSSSSRLLFPAAVPAAVATAVVAAALLLVTTSRMSRLATIPTARPPTKMCHSSRPEATLLEKSEKSELVNFSTRKEISGACSLKAGALWGWDAIVACMPLAGAPS